MPELISNDTRVNRDLAGRNLDQIANDNISLLAYDFALFTEDAFRYYLFQFIRLVLSEKQPFSEDAFIQSLFVGSITQPGNTVIDTISQNEIEGICYFLAWCKNKIEMYKQKIIAFTMFIEWEDEIDNALQFWNAEKNQRLAKLHSAHL
jgi:hypothetical protein